MEKSPKSGVLGGAPAKINVGGPEDAPALRLAALRKRDREIFHPDSHMPAVEQITDIPARDAERVENEVRDQADGVQHPQHQVEEQLALEIELESRQAVELLRRIARSRIVLLSTRYASCRYDRGDPALIGLVETGRDWCLLGGHLVVVPLALGGLWNHDYTRFRHEKPFAIALEVVADLVALLDSDILVDNRAAHFRVAPDLAVVHHHGVVDLAIRMDEDRPAENRVAHEAARHDAAF